MGSVWLLALSLAVDAFAAAVCCAVRGAGRLGARDAGKIGLWFGGFQAGMTLAGGLFGALLSRRLYRAGAVLSFGLLAWLGVKMVLESLCPVPEGTQEAPSALTAATLAPLALATSLDALAAGVSLGYLEGELLRSAAAIGLVAFALSALGALLGRRAGQGLRRWAGAAGGGVLLWLGLRVLAG